MKAFNWQCPYCKRFCVVTDANFQTSQTTLDKGQRGTPRLIRQEFIICPNPDCRCFTFAVTLYWTNGGLEIKRENLEHHWTLLPLQGGEQYFEGIPTLILTDYQEATRIKHLSPRSAAILARRCLQNIIKDFFKVQKPQLDKALEAIRGRLDPLIVKAVDHKLQNDQRLDSLIKKSVSLSTEVTPEAVTELIWLVELLLKETYVDQFEKAKQIQPQNHDLS